MNTSPWLQAQRSQQHHFPSIFRSATPPPPTRPRSVVATNSPPRGRHVIPRSLSVLHARPPSAPLSIAPTVLVDDRDSPQQHATHADQNASTLGITHHVQVDYSAIQRIADGVERMVRSWTSENSCRAQVYAKAYDSLHAAVARGKDPEIDNGVATEHQHHPPQESINACTETAPFDPNPHTDVSAHPLAFQNLQSPAHPDSNEMDQNVFNVQQDHGNKDLVNDDQVEESNRGAQISFAGHAGYSIPNWSVGAPYAPSRISGAIKSNQDGSTSGEVLYTEGPSYAPDVKKLKTSNLCVHNHIHNHPSGLGLIHENEHVEKRTCGNNAHLGHNGLRMDYDTQEMARIQHGRSRQEELEAEVPLRLQHHHRIHHLQSAPVIIGDDTINSKSLVKSAVRSRSPSLRTGSLANNASNSLDIYRENTKDAANVTQNNSKANRQANASTEVSPDQSIEPANSKRRPLKEKYSENVPPSRPKTRFQIFSKPESGQKKSSLEDKGKIVTCLQKLLSKKEQELVSSKIREKELAGQVQDLQTTVQRGRVTQMEPKKLLSLLLALNEWLQSVKAGVVNDDPNLHRKAYQNVHALAHLRMNLEEPQLANRTNNQSPRIENLAAIVNKEIKTLQEILGKLTPHRKRPK